MEIHFNHITIIQNLPISNRIAAHSRTVGGFDRGMLRREPNLLRIAAAAWRTLGVTPNQPLGDGIAAAIPQDMPMACPPHSSRSIPAACTESVQSVWTWHTGLLAPALRQRVVQPIIQQEHQLARRALPRASYCERTTRHEKRNVDQYVAVRRVSDRDCRRRPT